jgi:hypothetical protein
VCHPAQLQWGELQVTCGLLCGAAGPHVIELSASCQTRELSSCRVPDTLFAFETAQQWLDAAFQGVLSKCFGGMPYNQQFELELANGCPTRLSSSAPFSPGQAACLSAELNGARWECGATLSCSKFLAFVNQL